MLDTAATFAFIRSMLTTVADLQTDGEYKSQRMEEMTNEVSKLRDELRQLRIRAAYAAIDTSPFANLSQYRGYGGVARRIDLIRDIRTYLKNQNGVDIGLKWGKDIADILIARMEVADSKINTCPRCGEDRNSVKREHTC
jgi:hypothetical protein